MASKKTNELASKQTLQLASKQVRELAFNKLLSCLPSKRQVSIADVFQANV